MECPYCHKKADEQTCYRCGGEISAVHTCPECGKQWTGILVEKVPEPAPPLPEVVGGGKIVNIFVVHNAKTVETIRGTLDDGRIFTLTAKQVGIMASEFNFTLRSAKGKHPSLEVHDKAL